MGTRSLNRANDKNHERFAAAQSRTSSGVIIALNQRWCFGAITGGVGRRCWLRPPQLITNIVRDKIGNLASRYERASVSARCPQNAALPHSISVLFHLGADDAKEAFALGIKNGRAGVFRAIDKAIKPLLQ